MKTAVLPKVVKADFIAEARDAGQLPPPGPPVVAIAGRSNVGKSTLLNSLAARRQLARTSKTPGRTRGLIFYDLQIEPPEEVGARLDVRLADLPGYGYAKVAKTERLSWGPLVEGFVTRTVSLRLVLVLVDGRRDFEDEERQLCGWLGEHQVPYRVVVTKVDKLSAGARGLLASRIAATIGVPPAAVVPVSAQTGLGIDRLWRIMLRSLPGDAEPG